MTDDRDQHPHGAGSSDSSGSDAVDAFFARERAQIRPGGADDLHWQQIVREARQQRRSRWLASAGGVAAAGLVASALVWGPGLVPGLRRDGAVSVATQSTRPVTQAPSATSTTASPTPSTTPSTGPAPAPGTPSAPMGSAAGLGAGFVANSASNAGHQQLFVLGSDVCPGGRCPVLRGSTDNGATWTTLSTFASSAHSSVPPELVQPGSALSQVRFANPLVGWVFGGSVEKTTDGGRTWHAYGHPGDTVLDVETDGTSVVVTSASQCTPGGCAGPLQVTTASVDASSATATTTLDAKQAGATSGNAVLVDAQIQLDKQRVIVLPKWTGRQPTDLALELTPTGLTALPTPAQCAKGTDLHVILTATIGGGGPLFALCATPDAASVSNTLVRSSDAGGSWQVMSVGALDLQASRIHLAASDDNNLVAVASPAPGEAPSTRAFIRVSHDSGRTWTTPVAPGGPWQWVGAPGGGQFYALSGRDGSLYRSVDQGDHWAPVPVSR